MGMSLSIPVLRVSMWSLMEQSVGIALCGAVAAVIVNNLVEQVRRRKSIAPVFFINTTHEKTRSRTLVSGSMPFHDELVPALEIGITVSAASNDNAFDTQSVARSVTTLVTSNCISKAAEDENNSTSQLVSELDVLELIPHMVQTPNTVTSSFWHDSSDASPVAAVVANRSVVTSRSVLTGIHAGPKADVSRSIDTVTAPLRPQETVPREVNIIAREEIDPLDDHFHSARDTFQERALHAGREELLETGESLFVMGEMLQVSGRRKEALEVLQRAEFVQKRAVEEIIMEVAEVMHKQGVKLKDRGNLPYLAMTLLGAAELLKASPTAANLKACSRVHLDFKPNFQKHGDLQKLVNELDSIFTIVSQDATALAQTLRAQAVCHREALRKKV